MVGCSIEGPANSRLTIIRMVKVSDAYSFEDLCEMDEKDMETLLEFYASGKVPRLSCLRAMDGRFDAFDGSFGFCVGC
jgi:precorrin-2 dehydrogenase / sirohydrochlorin ferrochelatase